MIYKFVKRSADEKKRTKDDFDKLKVSRSNMFEDQFPLLDFKAIALRQKK